MFWFHIQYVLLLNIDKKKNIFYFLNDTIVTKSSFHSSCKYYTHKQMKKQITPILFLIFFALVSCEKVEIFNSSIIGVWTNPQYNDSIIVYERTNVLPDNDYGLEIKADGTLKERKNIG